MSEVIIKVEGLGKLYQLGEVGTGTLSHDLNRWMARVRGKEDPYAKIGETNDRTRKGEGNYVWALKDVSFDVRQGEVLGIVGRNGAGKSTLLKLLSKVTKPTSGSVRIKGRIASLLEVGTGFHPEMTGRENIFLNGAILGMTKSEIRRKFDEIVDFAGVERYIDTPVKRYSSGMYVRLAFAVAAFLEPEILIVDEVLAVGDAEFQKKCLGRMKDVSVNDGRTVLFVSHNMAAVKQLCNRGVVLKYGALAYEAGVIEAVNFYQNSNEYDSSFEHQGNLEDAPGNDNIKLIKFEVKPGQGSLLSVSSGVDFELVFFCHKSEINLDVTFELINMDEIVVFHNGIVITSDNDTKKGYYTLRGHIPADLLNAGSYRFKLMFGESQKYLLYSCSDIIQFEIMNEAMGANTNILPGIIRPQLNLKASFQG